MLNAENISFKIGVKTLLEETNVSFESGKFHVIMGANGAGKSTLMKLLAGDLKPGTGAIYFQNKTLDELSKRELATIRAVLSQHYSINFPITVDDIVQMGRYPYYSSSPAQKDLEICQKSKELMEITDFSERDYNTLSGGEAQKVQMSRVLAQIWESNPDHEKILFLDEPVSHLDVKYQYQLLRIARALCKRNITVIAILHDINLALSFADRIMFMKKGRLIYDKMTPGEINSGIIDDVFDVHSQIIYPENHKPIIVF